MVLGKLPVSRRFTDLDLLYGKDLLRGWGWFGYFLSRLSFLSSFSLSLGDSPRYRLKYCLKGPLSPK